MLVLGVVDADGQRGATLEFLRHGGVELEAKEVHRRRLRLVFTIQVLIRDGEHAVEPRHVDPAAILDAAEFLELQGQLADAMAYAKRARAIFGLLPEPHRARQAEHIVERLQAHSHELGM